MKRDTHGDTPPAVSDNAGTIAQRSLLDILSQLRSELAASRLRLANFKADREAELNRLTEERSACEKSLISDSDMLAALLAEQNKLSSLDVALRRQVDADAAEIARLLAEIARRRQEAIEIASTFTFVVETGSLRNSGADGVVRIVLHAKEGVSPQLTLDESVEHGKTALGQSMVDTFVKFIPKGDTFRTISKITATFEPESLASDWFLGSITVKFPSSAPAVEPVYLPHHGWLTAKCKSVEIFPVSAVVYVVHIFTGSVLGASTDAAVSIELVGQSKSSGLRPLLSNPGKNPFEKGQCDVFEIATAGSLGCLTLLRISHDGAAPFCHSLQLIVGWTMQARVPGQHGSWNASWCSKRVPTNPRK